MTSSAIQNPKIQRLIDLFFEQAAERPEDFLRFFKQHAHELSSDELWSLMDALTERVGKNINELYAEKMGQPV